MLATSYLLNKMLASDTLNHGLLLCCSGIPSLPTVSSTGVNDGWQSSVVGWGWHGTKAAMGQWRPPWLRSASAARFVSVLCVVFYVGLIKIL